LEHYLDGRERARLYGHFRGELEFTRSKELLIRALPPPPAVVLDVGGGPGAYSLWLAGMGYRVHLIDATPLHVEQARQTAADFGLAAPASIAVGDARQLSHADDSADAVLLMGPLYHLTERAERIAALQEAYRCLHPGGILFAVGISRFASLLDGLSYGRFWNSDFYPIVQQDLADGQHRNPDCHPDYFTTTIFHHPDELRNEVEDAGFEVEQVLAIEGPVWAGTEIAEHWTDDRKREMLLATLRRIEAEPALMGASAHFAVIGRKLQDSCGLGIS